MERIRLSGWHCQLVFFQLFLLIIGGLWAADVSAVTQADNKINQLIIRYQPDVQARMTGMTPERLARRTEQTVTASTGLAVSYKRAISAVSGAHVLYLPYPMSHREAQQYAQSIMAQQPDIDYAEPDAWRYPLRTVPNDPEFNQQWHLMTPDDFPGAANVVNAWDLTKGSRDIVVAVLDGGTTNHTDLRANLVGGEASKSGYDMVDDDSSGDGDGRDSDPSDPGYSETESFWHGTHVGGIIAARPDNEKFLAGVGWNTRLLTVRILSESGGRLSDQVDGMLWAAGEPINGAPQNMNPAHIINMSIGTDGFETCSRTEQAAVDKLRDKGVSVVVAAGNENRNVEGSAPANCEGVISVSGVTPDGARTSFANYGEINDIAAPATNIYSTFNSGNRAPEEDSSAPEQGTSQAAPQVAGVLALMLAANEQLLDESVITKDALPALLEDKLERSARTFPADINGSDDPRGCDDQDTACVCTTETCGAGLLDAFQAVKAVSTPPQAKAGDDQQVDGETAITLDGGTSTDDSYGGKITRYLWEQTSGPTVTLNNADQAKADFTAPAAEQSDTQLAFKLTVTDDVGLQASDSLIVTVTGTGTDEDGADDDSSGGGGSLPLVILLMLSGLGLFRMTGLSGLHRRYKEGH